MTDEQIRMAMVLTPAYSDDADYAHKIRMGRAVLTAAALAQAGAEPASWTECERISNLPAVDEAIRALLEDQTADNATGLIRAILAGAAPAAPSAEPVGYLMRSRQLVLDAAEESPGEAADYLWRWVHGTKNIAQFEGHPDLEVVRLYAAPQPAPLMLNGLTAAETDATTSVAGLSDPLRVVDVAAEKIAFCEWASAPLRANKLPLDTWDGPGQNGGFKNPQTYAVFYGWLSHSRHAANSLPAREPIPFDQLVRMIPQYPPTSMDIINFGRAIEAAHGITAPAAQKEAP